MEEKIKALENQIESLRKRLETLEKNHEINLENSIKSNKAISSFMENNNELTKKIEANFATLEENDQKTYDKVNELIIIVNDITEGRI
ncbi:hypothetical protein [Hyunsoonleella rubra]|uniref:Uncharacterized protein n=1 Tax=Hyunsoonleella rubra TaxID=1737062 RepID=A0ABW5TD06_9FLAO